MQNDHNTPRMVSQFHQAQFPGWRPRSSLADTMRDFWRSDIPFVALPAPHAVSDILSEVESPGPHRWTEMYSLRRAREQARAEGSDWFRTEHSSDWQEIRLIGAPLAPEESVPSLHDKHHVPDLAEARSNHNLPVTRGIMQSTAMVWQHLKLSRLPPGGWIYPHRDIKAHNDLRLNYVWIPLHDASPNLKLYPHGYMPNQLGQMYLLNNSGYVHSVWNRDSHPRTVLLGRFDPFQSQLDMAQIHQAVQRQWYS